MVDEIKFPDARELRCQILLAEEAELAVLLPKGFANFQATLSELKPDKKIYVTTTPTFGIFKVMTFQMRSVRDHSSSQPPRAFAKFDDWNSIMSKLDTCGFIVKPVEIRRSGGLARSWTVSLF